MTEQLVERPSGRDAAERPAARERRVDIQVLRGIAVLGVLLFHLWPGRVPGGYVGVDVFFVISGFLITGQIVREIEGSGRLRLGLFWARRARRLLPAALLVAAVSLVGTLLVAPPTVWGQFFREIAAAVLYVENWVLAYDAVDYLAAENVASPVQHYWSLSAEEQFYLLWPLLALAAALPLGRRLGVRARIGVVFAVVVAVSVAVSIASTPVEPGLAYFGTHSRAWQFGLGGLIAILAPALAGLLPRAARLLLAWAGIAAIAAACFLFGSGTPFPGSAALLPTLGAAAVIVGATGEREWGPARLGRYALLDRLGDISYAAYLWHWPIFVLAGYAAAEGLGLAERAAIAAATILLAWLTTRFVETPARRYSLSLPGRVRATLLASLVAMALVAAPSLGLWAVHHDAAANAIADAQDAVDDETCLGAGVRNPAVDCSGWEPPAQLVPQPQYISEDITLLNRDSCVANRNTHRVIVCSYGQLGSEVRIALVGDSHATHWFPALHRLAEEEGWEITTMVKSSCEESAAPMETDNPVLNENCNEWRGLMRGILDETGPFDLVFVSHSTAGEKSLDGQEEAMAGYLGAWQKYIDTGSTIVVMHDTPRVEPTSLDCLEQNQSAPEDCAVPREGHAREFDHMAAAAGLIPGDAVVIDTTDVFCDEEHCYPAIGGVTVYRDSGHMSPTFSTTMAPIVRDRLLAALGALP